MKINETHPREKGFVLWVHCQNILDDPRISPALAEYNTNLCFSVLMVARIMITCIVIVHEFLSKHKP